MINDGIVRQRDGNAAIVGNAAGVSLVTGDAAAVTPSVCGQEVSARGQRRARVNRNPRGYRSSVARSSQLPTTDIYWAVAVVVDFDELVARAGWPMGAELAND